MTQPSPHGNDNSSPATVVVLSPERTEMLPPPADRRSFMAPNGPFMTACNECTMTCVREHGTRSARENGRSLRPPCFYKMVTEYSVEGGLSCWMQVPPAFVRRHLPHVDRKRIVLENAAGKPWPVVYFAEHGFVTGWAEFSTDNNLAIGDTLFFSFVEDAKFLVHVFGKAGCEKSVPTESAPRANPTPSPASRSYALGFSRSDAKSGGRGDWDGFPAPASLSHGGTYDPAADNTTPHTDLPTPDWIGRQYMDSKGRSSLSEFYKFQSQSTPAPRLNAPAPSWHGEAGPSTCPSDMNPGQQGEKKGAPRPWSRGQTWTQKQARALVAKARLRKTNTAPVAMSKLFGVFKSHQSSEKKRSFVESLESDGEIGFDAGSAYADERRHGKRDRRSDGAFVSSLDSLRWDDQEAAAADRRAFQGFGMNAPDARFPGRREILPYPFDDIPDYVPTYVPEYVQQPRKPGRPRKYPLPTMPHTGSLPESSQAMVVTEKRKRGRPFKNQTPDINLKPLREIFVSRRRKVTQAERDAALNAAYQSASLLRASATFIVVMRQSFVYRNFVLGVPRRFANRHMPDTNQEVTLVDEAWKGWYCSWNAGYKYISGRGWRNFALEHCIEEDDALLMEVLEQNEDALCIKARIFRVVPVPDGMTGWQSHVCPSNSHYEPNSGVPIEPILRAPGKFQPRLQQRQKCTRNQAHGKRVKHEPDYTEDSFTTSDSSEELD